MGDINLENYEVQKVIVSMSNIIDVCQKRTVAYRKMTLICPNERNLHWEGVCTPINDPPQKPGYIQDANLPPTYKEISSWTSVGWPPTISYRTNADHWWSSSIYILTQIKPSGCTGDTCCSWDRYVKSIIFWYDYEEQLHISIDGAKLQELVASNNPDPSKYTFARFEFRRGTADITDRLNNELLVNINGTESNNQFRGAITASYYMGSYLVADIRLMGSYANVSNPNVSVEEHLVCGYTTPIKKITYTITLPDTLVIVYTTSELVQKEKEPECNECQELKTITTETGEQTQICQPIVCSSDSDCPKGCKCVDGECQPEIICRSSKDCPEGQVCKNGKCVDEEEQKKDEQDIGSDFSIGINHITYKDDALDILYIPSSLATYDATGTYVGDAPYNQIDGIVVSKDGIYYYPHVRINSITDSFSEAGIMEFTQYAKFDDTPYFKEGQLIYGVLYGQVLFGGFINDISYTISEGEQLIKYTAISFRKDFEEAPWVFNYKNYNITTTEVLAKILSAAPRLYCRGSSGSLPKQTISEINLTNQTIGHGLSYLFSAAGTYAWHLGPDKIFRIYNLQNLPIESIYVAQEGNNLSDHPEYKVISMDLNYNLSDRVTRLIIRGDFKRDRNNNIIEDSDGNPTYLVYDTGWRGTAYTQFNVQHTKTLIEDRFKYIEGMQDDTPYMKQYADLYLKPLQDAYIGGSIDLEGILTNFSIGKSVRIYNTNLSYLNNQVLVIKDVEYDLDNKITRLSLTGNYWFGTDITKFFLTLEEKVYAIDKKLRALDYKEGELSIILGKITLLYSGPHAFEGRMMKVSTEDRQITIFPFRACDYYNVACFEDLKVGDLVQVHYRLVAVKPHRYVTANIYNRAYKIFRIT